MDDRLLIKAAYWSDLSEVRRLLESGVDPNIQDPSYDEEAATPLLYASENGAYEVVKLLLESGANPNITDYYYGQTPLMWATLAGRDATVRLLLESGADPNIQDVDGDNALIFATQQAQRKSIYKKEDYLIIIDLLKKHMIFDEPFDEPSPPDMEQMRREKEEATQRALIKLQSRVRGRQTRRKVRGERPRYGKWSEATTDRERHRRWIDATRDTYRFPVDDEIRGYLRSIYFPDSHPTVEEIKSGGKKKRKKTKKKKRKKSKKKTKKRNKNIIH